MGIFFFGQTKLDFFSFSGGVSSLMLAYFFKNFNRKNPCIFNTPKDAYLSQNLCSILFEALPTFIF